MTFALSDAKRRGWETLREIGIHFDHLANAIRIERVTRDRTARSLIAVKNMESNTLYREAFNNYNKTLPSEHLLINGYATEGFAEMVEKSLRNLMVKEKYSRYGAIVKMHDERIREAYVEFHVFFVDVIFETSEDKLAFMLSSAYDEMKERIAFLEK